MVESTRQVQTGDPFDRFDEAINDPGLYPNYQYERPRIQRQLEPLPQDRVPLFLSDYDQQYQDERYEDEAPEYTFGSRQPKAQTSRIVTGIVAATAVAAVVGLFSIDATRSVIVNAKASLASLAPASFGGAQPEAASPPAQPPPRIATAVAPEPRLAAPEAQAVYRSRPAEAAAVAPAAAAPGSGKPMDAFASLPSREEITAAYQSAMKGGQVAAVVPAAPLPQPAPAVPGARRMDPDELAGLLKRAKGLLAVGDITAARLLLERAADAQEAEAAMMLAGDLRSAGGGQPGHAQRHARSGHGKDLVPEGRQLGSADAKRRLWQIQN